MTQTVNTTIHIWAQQTQAAGHAGNVRFEDKTLYSYHTPIAVLVTQGTRTVALLSTGYWSKTTSAHQAVAERATQHYQQFHVNHLGPSGTTPDHRGNLDDYGRRYLSALSRLYTSRALYDRHRHELETLREEARCYARFFGLRFPRTYFPAIDDTQALPARARSERAAAAQQARDATLRAQERQSADEQLAAFRAGTRRTVASSTVFLRVRGDMVETSYGVAFPVAHAHRAFAVIQHCHTSGHSREIHDRSLLVGNYTINRIDADGTVQAGCHTVTYDEITRCARDLGVLPASSAGA